ncbi:hypothetical protein LX32DRAFT_298936 [Colletotrichum zoysiae]|uniref:Uncharacterized protein n=1 Tax=Colletotrichum zoysiae TaxID=1216348 RepID=A0AAD9H1J9_9PEZI|nr:hypothetical protein LX32DRAFT_298936 [Colletotrichum zoysiae]
MSSTTSTQPSPFRVETVQTDSSTIRHVFFHCITIPSSVCNCLMVIHGVLNRKTPPVSSSSHYPSPYQLNARPFFHQPA